MNGIAINAMVRRMIAGVLAAMAIAVFLHSSAPGSEHLAAVAPPPNVSVDTAAAIDALGKSLRAELGSRAARRAVCGVKIANLTGDRDVFAHRSTQPLTPASTMKLLTSSTALGLFGTSYRVRTPVLCDTFTAGTVHGNLYLQGHGDPTFTVNDLDSLVDALKARGVQHVTGDVVGDASYFDDVVDRALYSGDGEKVEEVPPISALVVNRNLVTVIAHAGAPGERVRVQTVPHVPAIALSSKAMTVGGRSTRGGGSRNGAAHKRVTQKGRRAARSQTHRKHADVAPGAPNIVSAVYILPARYGRRAHRGGHRGGRGRRSGVSFTDYRGAGGKQSVVVSGSLRVGATVAHTVELANPPLAAAGMLKHRLESNGITVDGEARVGAAPANAKVLVVKETPLVDILSVQNKESDNFYAEEVFKMIGAAACRPASATCVADSSVKYIKLFLANCKTNSGLCQIHDGSGLSHRTVITPDAKVDLLRFIHSRDSLYRAFYSTLAIGGVDGTIKHRMRGTPAENNVRAKTGTLSAVSALAGYVTTRDNELWAFDITMNGGGTHAGRKVQDRIVEKLAGFSYTPR